ncbi:hypothetical protein BG015_002569, partial [Linnemannia schmuckeri]
MAMLEPFCILPNTMLRGMGYHMHTCRLSPITSFGRKYLPPSPPLNALEYYGVLCGVEIGKYQITQVNGKPLMTRLPHTQTVTTRREVIRVFLNPSKIVEFYKAHGMQLATRRIGEPERYPVAGKLETRRKARVQRPGQIRWGREGEMVYPLKMDVDLEAQAAGTTVKEYERVLEEAKNIIDKEKEFLRKIKEPPENDEDCDQAKDRDVIDDLD